jgi:hypothetical protein
VQPGDPRDLVTAVLVATQQTYDPAAQGRASSSKNFDIRDLDYAIQRAMATGELRHYGNYPFEDRLHYRGQEVMGPTVFTMDQLAEATMHILSELQSLNSCTWKDVAELLGISDLMLWRLRIKPQALLALLRSLALSLEG